MSNTKDPSSTTPESFPGVKWCHPVEKTQDGIEKILEFASENYTRHTEWFLKHRDQAYLQLGAVITAEFALANLPSTKASPLLSIIIWAIFMLLSVGFGAAGIVGCRQAFKAAMESIATMNKAMWAMGFAGRIFVNKHPPVATQIPMLPDDIYFLPRRWVELENADTTDAFVRSKLGEKIGAAFWPIKGNTCYLATISIGILALGGFAIGLVLALQALLAASAPK